jgi:hypothetical protein
MIETQEPELFMELLSWCDNVKQINSGYQKARNEDGGAAAESFLIDFGLRSVELPAKHLAGRSICC